MPASDLSTEERILKAAHTVFVREGTQAASLKEIAQEANVNQALLHYYFSDKKTLADTVFQKVVSDFLPRLEAILTSDRSIEEKVETFVPRYIETMQANPYLPSYVVGEMNQNPEALKQRIRSMGLAPFENLDALDEQLRRRAEEGTLRPISVEQFVVNLVALCIFPFVARPLLEALLGMDDTFECFLEERKEQIPPFFLGALRPESGS